MKRSSSEQADHKVSVEAAAFDLVGDKPRGKEGPFYQPHFGALFRLR